MIVEEDPIRVIALAADESGRFRGPPFEVERDVPLTLLLYTRDLARLNVQPGEVPLATGTTGRRLPRADALFEATAGTDLEWRNLDTLPARLAELELAGPSPEQCAGGGGCYGDQRDAEELLCRVPCPVSPTGATHTPVSPVDPPRIAPCASGWSEEAGSVSVCSPPSRLECPVRQAQWIDGAGCVDVGSCPAGRFSGSVPSDAIFVDASASTGGDGTRSAPLRTLAEAVAAASPGDAIALAPGTYPAGVRLTDLTLYGACAAATELVDGAPDSVDVTVGGDVALFDLTIRPTTNTGVRLSAGATLQMVRTILIGASDTVTPLLDAGAGRIDAADVVIRPGRVPALMVAEGAVINLHHSVISGGAGLLSSGTAIELTLADTVIEKSIGDPVRTAGVLRMWRSLFDSVGGYAVRGSNARLDIDETVIRDAVDPDFGFAGGFYLVASTGTISRVLVEGVEQAALEVNVDSDLMIRDTVIRDMRQHDPTDQAIGLGTAQSSVRLQRVHMEELFAKGINATGASLVLKDVFIDGVTRSEVGASEPRAFGAVVYEGTVEMDRVLIRDAGTTGFWASGTTRLDVGDLTVEDAGVAAIVLRDTTGATLDGAELRRFGTTGVEIDGVNINLALRNIQAEGGAIGVDFGGGGNIEATDLHVAASSGLGLCIRDQVRLVLRKLTIEDVTTGVSAPCTVTTPPSGTGVFLNGQPDLMLSDFRLVDNETTGLHVNGGSTTKVTDGLIRGSFTGARIDPTIAPESLMIGVRFEDNRTVVDTF